MRRVLNKQKKFYYVTLSLLLVFALCLIVTGSWFTDTGSAKGDLETPKIQPTLVAGASYQELNAPIYWSSASENQNIYVKFNSENNNVTKQLCRIYFNIEWGTMVNNVWTAKTDQHHNSSALLPKFTADWKSGSNALTTDYYNNLLTNSGITDDTLQQLVDAGVYSTKEQARQDTLTSLLESQNCPIIPYYYKDVVNIKTMTNPILVCSGFAFGENFNSSSFTGLTAKITVSVESESVSDRVIGAREQSGTTVTKQGGYWIYNQDGSFREDRPSDTLVSHWKSSI